MNIVIIGHVDHGKSTVVGRLLADTGSLPEGKLAAVREQCRRNSKPFEYAFLLDALKDEQSQGITIDSARCFFRSAKREYIIIDAPGHIEFLKNMISGAARAEAALLIIDAKEGVRENSRRHGYLLGMLGIRQVAVCVNKMDLVGYSQQVFDSIREEYGRFLAKVGIAPRGFIPIAAREGDNMIAASANMGWYSGPAVLEMVDSFEKEPQPVAKPLRFPVQDVYKFTEQEDDRRIVAGRVETGSAAVGDQVVFLPSGKRSRIASVEAFSAPQRTSADAGTSVGFTLSEQIYVKPGELMCKADQPPARTTTRLRVNLFWLARQPMVMGRQYKLKLAGTRAPVWLTAIATVIDASTLSAETSRRQIERHEVAECTLQTLKPIACDPAADIPQTGRFVIIDNYEIAGGGIVTEVMDSSVSLLQDHVRRREQAWERSAITPALRSARHNQRPALVLISGPAGTSKQTLAKALEERLFASGRLVYYLGLSNSLVGLNADIKDFGERDEYLRRLGETSHLFTSAGMILITTVSDLDDDELTLIDTLNQPGDLLVVSVGEQRLARRRPDLAIERVGDVGHAATQIERLLEERSFLLEYNL